MDQLILNFEIKQFDEHLYDKCTNCREVISEGNFGILITSNVEYLSQCPSCGYPNIKYFLFSADSLHQAREQRLAIVNIYKQLFQRAGEKVLLTIQEPSGVIKI